MKKQYLDNTLNVKIFKSVSSTEDNSPKKAAFSTSITHVTTTHTSTQDSLSPQRANTNLPVLITQK